MRLYRYFWKALAGIFISILASCDNGSSTDSIDSASTEQVGDVMHLPEASYVKGHALLRNPTSWTDLQEAVSFLEQAVSEGNVDARAELVYALVRLGKYSEAELHLKTARSLSEQLSDKHRFWLKALDAKVNENHELEMLGWAALTNSYPDDRWAWYQFGAAHYVRGEYRDTVEKLERALAIESESSQWEASYIHYLRSKSYYRFGEYEHSINAAEPGLNSLSSRRSTYYRKTMAEFALGQIDDPDQAMQKYRDISQSEGKSESYTLAGMANFFFESMDYERAIRYATDSFNIAQEAYPSFLLGYALTESGDPEKGLEVLLSAAESHPGNAGVHSGIGWSLYRLGRLEEARESLLHARTLRSRTHFGLERDLKIVESAIDAADALPAPALRWWGD